MGVFNARAYNVYVYFCDTHMFSSFKLVEFARSRRARALIRRKMYGKTGRGISFSRYSPVSSARKMRTPHGFYLEDNLKNIVNPSQIRQSEAGTFVTQFPFLVENVQF